MSFQARKLRVQLPCGDKTLVEPEALCVFQTCPAGTCGFVTPTGCGPVAYTLNCGPTMVVTCHYPSCHFGTCGNFTCVFDTCGYHSPITCRFATCAITVVPTGCPAGTVEQPIDPGTIVIDPADLPALREHLEAQLAELDKAEQALKEREDKQ